MFIASASPVRSGRRIPASDRLPNCGRRQPTIDPHFGVVLHPAEVQPNLSARRGGERYFRPVHGAAARPVALVVEDDLAAQPGGLVHAGSESFQVGRFVVVAAIHAETGLEGQGLGLAPALVFG